MAPTLQMPSADSCWQTKRAPQLTHDESVFPDSDDGEFLPVANASKLDGLTSAILSLDGFDPSCSSFFRRFEMLVLPRLKVKAWVTQRRQRVLRHGILQHPLVISSERKQIILTPRK
jgi:hypothetical protein